MKKIFRYKYQLLIIGFIFCFQLVNAQVIINKDPRIDWLRNIQINLNKISSPNTTTYSLLVAYTKQREEALEAKRIIYTNFPETKVFLDYNTPYYRVRAGSYITLEEAQDAKSSIQTFFDREVTIINSRSTKL